GVGFAASVADPERAGGISGGAGVCRGGVGGLGGLAGQRAGAGVRAARARRGDLVSAPCLADVGAGRIDHAEPAAAGARLGGARRGGDAVPSLLGARAPRGGTRTRLAGAIGARIARARSGSGKVFERQRAPRTGATINGAAATLAGSRQTTWKLGFR